MVLRQEYQAAPVCIARGAPNRRRHGCASDQRRPRAAVVAGVLPARAAGWWSREQVVGDRLRRAEHHQVAGVLQYRRDGLRGVVRMKNTSRRIRRDNLDFRDQFGRAPDRAETWMNFLEVKVPSERYPQEKAWRLPLTGGAYRSPDSTSKHIQNRRFRQRQEAKGRRLQLFPGGEARLRRTTRGPLGVAPKR